LLVSLSLVIIAAVYFSMALGNYFQFGLTALETVFYTLCFIILVVLVSTWILNLMSTHQKLKPAWLALYTKWMLVNIYYYFAKWLGTISMQKKTDLQESFLNINNEIVLTAAKDINHRNILVLLPGCLQKSDCKIRITSDINDCERCGECDMTAVNELAAKYNVKAAVATGGAVARKLIHDLKPDVIVAVACHRDLTDGVRESWRYPVYAVLNDRPKGPCFETTVNIRTIEFAIKKFQ